MDYKTLINHVSIVADHVRYAFDCYLVYFSIINVIQKENEKINLSPAFFTIVMHSLVETMIMNLARLFCGTDKREINFSSLLLECLLFAQMEPEFQNSKEIIGLVSGMQIDIEKNQKIIVKIKNRRNKIYAHNDTNYSGDTQKMLSKLPIDKDELKALLLSAGKFTFKLRAMLDGEKMAPYSLGCGDLINLLDKVIIK